MRSLSSWLLLAHLIGLAFALGSATIKWALLSRCRGQHDLVPAYLKVVPVVTRTLVFGMILLTASGLALIFTGAGFSPTPLWIAKLVLVGAIWIIGPVIDKVVEPRFRQAAAVAADATSQDYARSYRRYLGIESLATALMFAVTAGWVLG